MHVRAFAGKLPFNKRLRQVLNAMVFTAKLAKLVKLQKAEFQYADNRTVLIPNMKKLVRNCAVPQDPTKCFEQLNRSLEF